jgi:hypothetical protein
LKNKNNAADEKQQKTPNKNEEDNRKLKED